MNTALNLLTIDQKALLSTMKATGSTLHIYLFGEPQTDSFDEMMVCMMINQGDLVLEILEHLYTVHNICIDVQDNAEVIHAMITAMYNLTNDAIDMCNLDKKFDDALEVLDYAKTAPDEEFAKYFIELKERLEQNNIFVSGIEKNADIFQLTYWMKVLCENLVQLKFSLYLREEKYW